MDFETFCNQFDSCWECPLSFTDSHEMCEFMFDLVMDNGGEFNIDILEYVDEDY